MRTLLLLSLRSGRREPCLCLSGRQRALGTRGRQGDTGGQEDPATRDRANKMKRRQRRRESLEAALEEPPGRSREFKPVPESERYEVNTKPGDKKDTSIPLPRSFSPRFVEAAWGPWWEKQGFFSPEYHDRLPHRVSTSFSLCLPPPNVTGTLHLGHALTAALQDALARWHRMLGHRVVWVPSRDHAGIATQVVVERHLAKERGLSRHQLGRNEFLRQTRHWADTKGVQIYSQLRSLGASLDWSRDRFTMDEGFSRAVREAFVRLHEAGLLQRGEQLVNWSCHLRSAISDEEVDMVRLPGPTLRRVPGYEQEVEFGVMQIVAYRLVRQHAAVPGPDELLVGTTRVETMPGDVALAVHPSDARYQHVVGCSVLHPLDGRLLPVIADGSVDPQLATGVVKVSPAHDEVDRYIAARHGLPSISVMDEDGRMGAQAGPGLEGLPRFCARAEVLRRLGDARLLRRSEPHGTVLPICSRSGDVVEPMVKSQWFVRCQDMGQRAAQAVQDGRLELIPPSLHKSWTSWLSNVKDWCVSRQIWWGHRVPAYRVLPTAATATTATTATTTAKEELWVCAHDESEATLKAQSQLGLQPGTFTLQQDEDVLDTWFSSALLPFAVLGWPDQTPDVASFYPNSLLETGQDLLFFWAARMAMLGQQLTGQLPFPQMYFHAMVRDARGRKMSKSLGNVIDPMDVINGASLPDLQRKLRAGNLDPRELKTAEEGQRKEFPSGIPESGADGLRLGLYSLRTTGDEVSVDVATVLSWRHFCNKVWNAFRFTQGALGPEYSPAPLTGVVVEGAGMPAWLLSRVAVAVRAFNGALRGLSFPAASSAVHALWLHDLCDVYLESVKPVLAAAAAAAATGGAGGSSAEEAAARAALGALHAAVEVGLRLLAPLAPFVAEELWQRHPRAAADAAPSVCVAAFPTDELTAGWLSPAVEEDVELMMEVVRTVRTLRAQYGLTRERPPLMVEAGSERVSRVLSTLGVPLCALCRCRELRLLEAAATAPGHCTGAVAAGGVAAVYLPLQGVVDSERELRRLGAARDRTLSRLSAARRRDGDEGYRRATPESTRQEHRAQMEALEKEVAGLDRMLERLGDAATRGG